jgi:membrane protein implicated in regulation of membrane protease activity
MFLLVGGILAVVIDNADTAKFVIILISIAWAFVFGPWAIVTFFELVLAYAFVKKINKRDC